MTARLAIATLDPRVIVGGVQSMTKTVYEFAVESGLDPFLVFNSLKRPTDNRIQYLPGWKTSVERIDIDGMEAVAIPRYLPEFEPLQYRLNRRHWKAVLEEADLYFAVGGSILTAQPYYYLDRPYAAWTATPLRDERESRLEVYSLPMRIREQLSLPVLQWLERKLHRAADHSTVISDHTRSKLLSSHGIESAAVDVIRYPIEVERFTSNETPNDDGFAVLFVGRLNARRKNVPRLLKAFAYAASKVNAPQLRLVGGAPDQNLRDLTEDLGIAETTEFIDYVPNDELPSYYSEADLFVIPSNQEGLGIVGLEAMACGTPVISTPCGGPKDYIVDGKNGFMTGFDYREIGDRMIQLADDQELLDTLGAAAMDTVHQRYNKDTIQEQFADLFREMRA